MNPIGELSIGWVPDACTLPTADQPGRIAEFDQLIRAGIVDQDRLSEQRLRWTLRPEVEAFVRDLADRESGCCSFFTFTFVRSAEHLMLDVAVPPSSTDVLDALAHRVEATKPASNQAR